MNRQSFLDIITRAQTAGLDQADAALRRHEAAVDRLMGKLLSTGTAASTAGAQVTKSLNQIPLLAQRAIAPIQNLANAVGAGLTRAFQMAQAAASGLFRMIGSIGGVAANLAGVGGLIVTAFGAAAIRAASNFEEQLAIINTIAQQTPENLRIIGQGIRDLAAQTGESIENMAQGYYDILSAMPDISMAGAQKILDAAVTLALGGLATPAEAIDLLTTAINAYGFAASDATHVTDVFATAIKYGKVTADEIAATFSQTAGLASNAGVEIEELAAAYGTLTSRGFSAGEAMTGARGFIIGLQRQNTQLRAAQEALGGINFVDIIREQGLQQAAQLLRQYSEDSGVPLIKLLGRIEATNFALAITGHNTELYGQVLAAAFEDSGEAARQMQARMENLDQATRSLGQSWQSFLIEVGTPFLEGLEAFTRQITVLVQAATEWARANQGLIQTFGPIVLKVSALLALRAGLGGLLLLMGPFISHLGAGAIGLNGLFVVMSRLAVPAAILVGAFGLLQIKMQGNDTLALRLRSAFQRLGGVFSAVVDLIQVGARIVGAVFETLFSETKGGFDAVALTLDRWSHAWNQALDIVTNRAGAFGDAMEALFGPSFRSIVGQAIDAIADFFYLGRGATGSALGSLVDVVGRLFDAIVKLAREAVPLAIEVFRRLGQLLIPLAGVILVALLEAVTAVITVIADLFAWFNRGSDAANAVGTSLGVMLRVLLAIWAVNKVLSFFVGMYTALQNLGSAMMTAYRPTILMVQALAQLSRMGFDLGMSGIDAATSGLRTLSGELDKLRGKSVLIGAQGWQRASQGVQNLIDKINDLRGKSVRVGITGGRGAMNMIDDLQERINNLRGKTVEIKIPGFGAGGDGGFAINPGKLVEGMLQGIGFFLVTEGPKLLKGKWSTVLERLAPLMATAARAGPWGIVAAAIILAVGTAIVAPELAGNIAGALFGLWVTAWLLLANMALIPATFGLTLLNQIIAAIAPIPGQIADWIGERFAEIDIDILGFLNLDELLPKLAAPFAAIAIGVGELWDAVWDLDPAAIGDALLDLAEAVITLPVDLIATIGTWLADLLIDAVGWAFDRVIGVGGWISTELQALPGRIGEWWSQIEWPEISLDFLPDFDIQLPDINLGAWWDTITKGFTDKVEDFKGLWDDLTGEDSIFAQFGEQLSILASTIGGWVNGILAAMGDMVAGIIGAMITLEEAMPGDPDSAYIAKLRTMQTEADAWGEATKTAWRDTGANIKTESDAMVTEPARIAAALRDAIIPTTTAAAALSGAVTLDPIDGYQYGWNYGNSIAQGMINSGWIISEAAYDLSNRIQQSGPTISSEPKWSGNPLRGITKWGGNYVRTIAGGMMAALPIMQNAAMAVSQAAMPQFVQPAFAGGPQQAIMLSGTGVDADGISHGIIDRRSMELLNGVLNENKVQNAQLARLVAEDPRAAGPLAARSALEMERTIQPVRGPRQ